MILPTVFRPGRSSPTDRAFNSQPLNEACATCRHLRYEMNDTVRLSVWPAHWWFPCVS